MFSFVFFPFFNLSYRIIYFKFSLTGFVCSKTPPWKRTFTHTPPFSSSFPFCSSSSFLSSFFLFSFSPQMQTRYVWFTLLCCLPFLCAELSLQCSPSQYAWPSESPRFCCEMCKPGRTSLQRYPWVNVLVKSLFNCLNFYCAQGHICRHVSKTPAAPSAGIVQSSTYTATRTT